MGFHCFVQALLGVYFGYTTVNSEWAEAEGVKLTAEGWIAPLGFLILYIILLVNMSDILYATAAAIEGS